METIQLRELTGLTPTKSNALYVASELTEPLKNGDIDAVEFAIRTNFAIETLTECLKIAKDYVLKQDISTGVTLLGARVETAESGVKYDYSANNIWSDIEQRLAPLLAEKKAIEDKIKMATKIGQNIVSDDGEVIASPVTKSSTTVLKITLGK